MGRPRVYEEPRVATAVRLPVALHDRLRAVATEHDVSVNLLVTRAVTDYLGRLASEGDATHHGAAGHAAAQLGGRAAL